MLNVPDEVYAALGDTEVTSFPTAVAQYQGRSAVLNVHPAEGGLTWSDGSGEQCNGSFRAVGFGESLVPKSRDALLAPTGQEVTISRVVRLRSGDHTIPLGVFRITGNDGGRETYRWERTPVRVDAPAIVTGDWFPADDEFPDDDVFPGDYMGGPFTYRTEPARTSDVLDWEVGVDVADRLRMLQRGKIINPASPPSGATVYSELQRLTLFPIEMSPAVPDVPVPAGTTYEDRRSAVATLAEIAGAKVRVTRQGALTLRPADRWLTETVVEFDLDGVIEFAAEQSDDFYNYVWAHSPNGEFSAFASLTDDADPRSVGRAGPSTYEHSSPVYTSYAAAAQGAESALRRLLNRRSRLVTVSLDARGLLLDLSDFGRVTDPTTGRTVAGEVTSLRVSNNPTSPVEATLIVAEES
jgi:hypothetical protein